AVPDAAAFRSKLYHLYNDETVRGDISRSARPEEPLPALLTNAYRLLGADWLEAYKAWKRDDPGAVPPVMVTVANRTETAARVKHMFDHTRRVPIEELCDPAYTLQVDSTTVDADEALREKAGTVGQRGKPGEQVRNVVSVAMLSEGWDAKNVTHILGLRAFTSQLLCEQVVGRGLRRTSYEPEEGTEMFTPEYVNIYGIPFSFLPHESAEAGAPRPPKPKTQVEPLPEKAEFAISFPNIARIDRVFKPVLSADIGRIETLYLDADKLRFQVGLMKEFRMQEMIFRAVAEAFSAMDAAWQREGTPFALIGQVIGLVERYLECGAIRINPPLFNRDPARRRMTLMLNMGDIVRRLWDFIQVEQTSRLAPVFDAGQKVRSTGDMGAWYTGRPCRITEKSHISHCVFDGAWEDAESCRIQNDPNVAAWVKNDHIGFEVVYVYEGVVRKYFPDFLIRLRNGNMLVLETKGRRTPQSEAKRKALEEWTAAVNGLGEYGAWRSEVSYHIADVGEIIARHSA
ncbi:MAG: type III restriction endonuclease subunit R, partial [Firmicutes bacterium]|nr:type III restriction endonuclease subunit R [Bacillota bacterium]